MTRRIRASILASAAVALLLTGCGPRTVYDPDLLIGTTWTGTDVANEWVVVFRDGGVLDVELNGSPAPYEYDWRVEDGLVYLDLPVEGVSATGQPFTGAIPVNAPYNGPYRELALIGLGPAGIQVLILEPG